MEFNSAVIPFLVLLVLGVFPQFYLIRLLSKQVSREKINQIEDLSALWKMTIPPSSVLTEKGLKLQKWYRIYLVFIVIAATGIGLYLTGFSLSPISIT